MRYHCMIFFDPQKVFNGSPESNAVLAEIGPHDSKLRASGHFVTSEPLNLPKEAVTVRVRDGKTSKIDGPFMETREMLGGLVVIEARDLDEAASSGSAPANRVCRRQRSIVLKRPAETSQA